MTNKQHYIEISLILFFFGLLIYAAYLSFKSIDFQALSKIEKTILVLPTQIPTQPASPSAQPSKP